MLLAGATILIGLLVGTLVGLTGLGGGVLLLPILIFGLRVPPIVAVGSDALFNCITKIGAGYLHWRQKTVRLRVVLALVTGSAPGAILGVALLNQIRLLYGNGVNDFIKSAVGILLVGIPTLLLFQGRVEYDLGDPKSLGTKSYLGMTTIGLLAGFLVGLTSVGSGSIIMMLMLLFFRYSPKVMVGTDIVHAVLLTALTGVLHFRLGNVNPRLVVSLVIGSIPGAVIGARLSNYVPIPWLRRVLCALLLTTGARMLWT